MLRWHPHFLRSFQLEITNLFAHLRAQWELLPPAWATYISAFLNFDASPEFQSETTLSAPCVNLDIRALDVSNSTFVWRCIVHQPFLHMNAKRVTVRVMNLALVDKAISQLSDVAGEPSGPFVSPWKFQPLHTKEFYSKESSPSPMSPPPPPPPPPPPSSSSLPEPSLSQTETFQRPTATDEDVIDIPRTIISIGRTDASVELSVDPLQTQVHLGPISITVAPIDVLHALELVKNFEDFLLQNETDQELYEDLQCHVSNEVGYWKTEMQCPSFEVKLATAMVSISFKAQGLSANISQDPSLLSCQVGQFMAEKFVCYSSPSLLETWSDSAAAVKIQFERDRVVLFVRGDATLTEELLLKWLDGEYPQRLQKALSLSRKICLMAVELGSPQQAWDICGILRSKIEAAQLPYSAWLGTPNRTSLQCSILNFRLCLCSEILVSLTKAIAPIVEPFQEYLGIRKVVDKENTSVDKTAPLPLSPQEKHGSDIFSFANLTVASAALDLNNFEIVFVKKASECTRSLAIGGSLRANLRISDAQSWITAKLSNCSALLGEKPVRVRYEGDTSHSQVSHVKAEKNRSAMGKEGAGRVASASGSIANISYNSPSCSFEPIKTHRLLFPFNVSLLFSDAVDEEKVNILSSKIDFALSADDINELWGIFRTWWAAFDEARIALNLHTAKHSWDQRIRLAVPWTIPGRKFRPNTKKQIAMEIGSLNVMLLDVQGPIMLSTGCELAIQLFTSSDDVFSAQGTAHAEVRLSDSVCGGEIITCLLILERIKAGVISLVGSLFLSLFLSFSPSLSFFLSFSLSLSFSPSPSFFLSFFLSSLSFFFAKILSHSSITSFSQFSPS